MVTDLAESATEYLIMYVRPMPGDIYTDIRQLQNVMRLMEEWTEYSHPLKSPAGNDLLFRLIDFNNLREAKRLEESQPPRPSNNGSVTFYAPAFDETDLQVSPQHGNVTYYYDDDGIQVDEAAHQRP